MVDTTVQWADFWRLVHRQHGVIARQQLLDLGFSRRAIQHRAATGRLHPLWRGVYVVGRPEVTRRGVWMAAVLACGAGAVVSHSSAAALWQIAPDVAGPVHVSIAENARRSHSGIRVHRRAALRPEHVSLRHGIPVTNPICTLIDLAAELPRDRLEASIREADKRGLTDPERLRAALDQEPPRRGTAKLRATLDLRTFALTDSELERSFMRIVRRAGLPLPLTQQWVNGYRVDFYWPALRLVVETDGLRYHRTPAQQAKDRLRDQAHTAAGLTVLRFTHAQVRYESDRVRATLAAVARRLAA